MVSGLRNLVCQERWGELDSIQKTKDARRNNNPSNTFKNQKKKKDINKEYTNISTTEDLGMTKTELRDFSHPNTGHTKLCSKKLPNQS